MYYNMKLNKINKYLKKINYFIIFSKIIDMYKFELYLN